jgi:hypothetical protein
MMCSVGDDEVSVNMSRFKKELESALGSSDMFAEFSHDPSAYDLDISDSDMDYGESGSEEEDEELQSGEVVASKATISEQEPTSKLTGANYADGDDGFSSAYSSALEHELHQTSIAKSFITAEDATEQQPEVFLSSILCLSVFTPSAHGELSLVWDCLVVFQTR